MIRLTRMDWGHLDEDTLELTFTQDSQIAHLCNEDLVGEGVLLSDLLGQLSDRLRALQLEIKVRMLSDGATEYAGPAGTATLKASRSYDPFKLDTLLELLPEQELVEDGALTPAHEKTVAVERKWNMTKLRKFGRRGKAIRAVFEDALTEGGHRVEFKPHG